MTNLEMWDAEMASFKVPPVCTARWDKAAWIKWVDSNGYWHRRNPQWLMETSHD